MPQQSFPISFLIHPGSYREVAAVGIPLSFSTAWSKEGHVFSYNPFSIYESIKMPDTSLADRINEYEAEEALLIGSEQYGELSPEGTWLQVKAGEVYEIRHAQFDYLQAAEASNMKEASSNELKSAEKDILSNDAQIDIMSLAQKFIDFREATFSLSDAPISYRAEISKEAYYQDSILTSIRKVMDEAVTFDIASLGAHEIIRDAVLSSDDLLAANITERVANIANDILKGESNTDREGIKVIDAITGVRDMREADSFAVIQQSERLSRPSKIINRIVEAVRDKKEGLKQTLISLAERDKEKSSLIRNVMQFASNIGRTSFLNLKHRLFDKYTKGSMVVEKQFMWDKHQHESSYTATQYLTAVVEGKSSDYEDKVKYAEFGTSKVFEGYVDTSIIAAELGTLEAIIHKSVIFMEKNDILSEFLQLVELERAGEKEISMLHSILANTKEFKDTIVSKIIPSFSKREHDSLWLERTLYAMQSENRALFVDTIKSANTIDKETIIEALELAEIPKTLEGIVEGVTNRLKLAKNYDKDNRPAGMLTIKGAEWDVGFDDVMAMWEPGWDYLDVPDRDVDYTAIEKLSYNQYGVPYYPLEPANKPDVKIRPTPSSHPFPEWSDIGKEEQWVELFTFQDALIAIVMLYKKQMSRLAGMNGHEALRFVLQELESHMKATTPWTKEHERMLRFVRWYAEMIALKHSYSILHRTYGPWIADIHKYYQTYVNNGDIDGITTNPNGLLESSSVQGFLNVDGRNFIDAEFIFSAAIVSSNPASTSKIDFYIDNVLVQTITPSHGVQQWVHNVDEGYHYYRLEYTCEVGDLVRLSGIQLTGFEFIDAHTTLHPDDTRGPAVVNSLVNMLITYYQKHHKDKQKGAMSIKQRKIWLS